MAKNATKRDSRKKQSLQATARATVRRRLGPALRFNQERLKWLADGTNSTTAGTQTLTPRDRVEAEVWTRLPCDRVKPCSQRRTCANHLVLVRSWSGSDSISLSAAPFNLSLGSEVQIQRVTRKSRIPKTIKMKEFVDHHPEEWPGQDTWRVVEQETRECIDRLVGTDPERAAALGQLIRALRLTAGTPVNVQHKMATIAIDHTWDLTKLFERALSVGISVGELSVLNDQS
jgi:hypothetical protein